jgi:hypothetical protein
MAFDAFLDGVVDQVIHGWAWNPDSAATHCTVDVLIDSEIVARLIANHYRKDVAEAGVGDGDHAFIYQVPDRFADGNPHEIAVYHSTSRELIRNGCQTVVISKRADPPTLRAPSNDSSRRPAGSLRWLKAISRSTPPGVDAAAQHGRVAIVAMYMPGGRLWAYQRRLLSSIRETGFRVILVHNSEDAAAAIQEEASAFTDVCVARPNVGLDFGAWRLGLTWFLNKLDAMTELVLVNDSVFGPLHPLDQVFDRMATRQADFWGITDSWAHAYHLQSYFLVFRKRALTHPAFRRFWETYRTPLHKDRIIADGEIGLSQTLINAGLTPAAFCPYAELASHTLELIRPRLADLKKLLAPRDSTIPDAFDQVNERTFDYYNFVVTQIAAGVPLNPAAYFWEALVTAFGAPFFKRELILRNPAGDPNPVLMLDALTRMLEFPAEFIEEVRRETPQNTTPPVPGAAAATKIERPPRGRVLGLRR